MRSECLGHEVITEVAAENAALLERGPAFLSGASGDDPAQIPYWLQADASLNNERIVRRRLALRHDSLVELPLLAWWECAMHSLSAKPYLDGQREVEKQLQVSSQNQSPSPSNHHTPSQLSSQPPYGIAKEGYLRIFRKVTRCMLPRRGLADTAQEEEEERALRDEWTQDSLGLPVLSRERFCDAVFQLADLWTSGVDPVEYADFLWKLLHHIATRIRCGCPGRCKKRLGDAEWTQSQSHGQSKPNRRLPCELPVYRFKDDSRIRYSSDYDDEVMEDAARRRAMVEDAAAARDAEDVEAKAVREADVDLAKAGTDAEVRAAEAAEDMQASSKRQHALSLADGTAQTTIRRVEEVNSRRRNMIPRRAKGTVDFGLVQTLPLTHGDEKHGSSDGVKPWRSGLAPSEAVIAAFGGGSPGLATPRCAYDRNARSKLRAFSAVNIQTAFRGHVCRAAATLRRSCVRVIQAVGRGRLGRNRARVRRVAIVTVQKEARRISARTAFCTHQAAILLIQSHSRCILPRRLLRQRQMFLQLGLRCYPSWWLDVDEATRQQYTWSLSRPTCRWELLTAGGRGGGQGRDGRLRSCAVGVDAVATGLVAAPVAATKVVVLPMAAVQVGSPRRYCCPPPPLPPHSKQRTPRQTAGRPKGCVLLSSHLATLRLSAERRLRADKPSIYKLPPSLPSFSTVADEGACRGVMMSEAAGGVEAAHRSAACKDQSRACGQVQPSSPARTHPPRRLTHLNDTLMVSEMASPALRKASPRQQQATPRRGSDAILNTPSFVSPVQSMAQVALSPARVSHGVFLSPPIEADAPLQPAAVASKSKPSGVRSQLVAASSRLPGQVMPMAKPTSMYTALSRGGSPRPSSARATARYGHTRGHGIDAARQVPNGLAARPSSAQYPLTGLLPHSVVALAHVDDDFCSPPREPPPFILPPPPSTPTPSES